MRYIKIDLIFAGISFLFKTFSLLIPFLILFFVRFSLVMARQTPNLPPEEMAIQNNVDHWGLAFSDQFQVFESNFHHISKKSGMPYPDYIIGIENSLQKTFQNKYWFKGEATDIVRLKCARNESEAFQLAIIPKTGFSLQDIQITHSDLQLTNGKETISKEAIHLWRIGFVKTTPPQYPTKHVGDWPDPLLPLTPFSLDGIDLGLVWCEIHVPEEALPGDYTGTIVIRPSNSDPQKCTIRLHVWDFALPDRIPFPTIVWVGDRTSKGERMDPKAYRSLCTLFLKHHIDPISVGKNSDFDLLDQNLDFCMRQGLMVFETIPFRDEKNFRPYYEHLKKKGWLHKAMIYGVRDEPTREQFENLVVPATTTIRKEFPGLKVFLATQYYDGLDRGLDIWLTDVSTNFHSWLKAGRPGNQAPWWYFCHLPIQAQMERPLVEAPNMQIDNDAIEHRVPYWMAYDYGIKGIFIYAGNRWPKGNDAFPEKPFQLPHKTYNFPYAGIHNGNGFLIYPGPFPSIRLKNLRDGIEDYWYLSKVFELSLVSKWQKEARALLRGIKPAIFVDTHYFNRNTDALNTYRKSLGDFIDKAKKQTDCSIRRFMIKGERGCYMKRFN